MKSRSLWVAALVAPLLSSVVARAEVRIAYVDMQRAVLEVDEGRAAKVRLQALVDAQEKDLARQQQELKVEKDQLDKQSSAMTDQARTQRQIDLSKKVYEFQQRVEKGRQDLGDKQRAELQPIFQKLDAVVAAIAQREGFSLVFDKTGSGVVYAPQNLDLTNELVRLYNEQHKPGEKKK